MISVATSIVKIIHNNITCLIPFDTSVMIPLPLMCRSNCVHLFTSTCVMAVHVWECVRVCRLGYLCVCVFKRGCESWLTVHSFFTVR